MPGNLVRAWQLFAETHVIAKVFLILLLTCAYRKYIDITQVVRTLEEKNMLARKDVFRYARAFKADYPRAHLTPSFGSRHLRTHFQLPTSTIRSPNGWFLLFDESINAVFLSLLRSSVNALLTIVLSPLNIFSPRDKRREEQKHFIYSRNATFANNREGKFCLLKSFKRHNRLVFYLLLVRRIMDDV